MYKIHPTGHRVLVKIKPYEETTKSGLVVATASSREAHTKALQEAIVVEIGKQAFVGFADGAAWCAVGDKILMTRYCGEDRIHPETKEIYRIINDDDILAVLEGED